MPDALNLPRWHKPATVGGSHRASHLNASIAIVGTELAAMKKQFSVEESGVIRFDGFGHLPLPVSLKTTDSVSASYSLPP